MNLTVIVHEVSLSHKGNCLKKVPSPEIENKLFQQKKSKQLRFWEHTFLKKNPGIFRFVTLPFEILQRKQSFIPRKFTEFCDMVTPLGNSNAKNQNPWKFLMIFSGSPLEIPHFFFNWPPWNFHKLFLQYTPGNSMSSTSLPPLSGFFLELIVQYCFDGWETMTNW